MAAAAQAAWIAGHGRVALALTLLVAVLGAFLPPAPLDLRLALVAGLVAVLGLPHGAVDHWQGRAVLAGRWGRLWPAVFAGGYTLAALAVVLAWVAWPPGLLVGFLLLAIGHFGAEDVAAGPLVSERPGLGRVVEAALRGAVPVLLPILFHPAPTGTLFAALLPGVEPAAVARVHLAMAPIAWAYIAGLGGLAALALLRGRRRGAAELAALTAAFAALPPLLGFAVYFCLWHSPRHTLAVIAQSDAPNLAQGLKRFAAAALPLTAVTLFFALVAWVILVERGGATAAATLQVVFVGLAALTVPHVLLAARRPTGFDCN